MDRIDPGATQKTGAARLFEIAFGLFNPRVIEAVDRLTFDFCEATNQTSTKRLADALASLRQELADGLGEGEVYARLTRRVKAIFNDPYRAPMIATTESSRAMHAGQFMVAADSGIVRGKRWLASSDACPLCLGLNGKEVGLHEVFAVVGSGPYSKVPYPPAHPHCMCTWEEVIG